MSRLYSKASLTIYLPIFVLTAFIAYGFVHFDFLVPQQGLGVLFSDVLHSWWGRVLFCLALTNLYQLLARLSTTETYQDLLIRLWPNQIDARYQRGVFLYNKQAFDAAAQDFTKVTHLQPTHADAFVYLGLIHKAKDEAIDAIAAFTNALNIDSKNLYALYHRSYCKSDQQDYNGAIRDLTRAIEIDSKNADFYFLRGYCHQQLADYAAAIHDYDAGVAISPKNANIYLNRGYCHYLIGNVAKALSDYDVGIELDPTNAYLYQLRGIAYGDLDEFDRSIADLSHSAELAPSVVESWLNLSKIYAKKGDNEKATHYLEKALEIKPDDPSVMLHHAILLFNQGAPSALELLDQAVEASPNRKDILATRAQALMELGKYEPAIVDWDRVIAAKSADRDSYLKRAKCKAKSGDATGTIADCEAALRGGKKNAVASAEIGRYLRIGHFWTESLALHQMIVELSPQCWQGWIGLADTARHLKDNELYAQALEQTRKWLPTHSAYDLACLESVAGNLALAKEYLMTGLKEQPQLKPWAKKDPELFWLRQDAQAVELFE
ncbi:MAG: tetratricopeptide repeat protein [Caldilineaceae bacterium]